MGFWGERGGRSAHLKDKYLAGPGEKRWRLGRNHAHVLVRLHDFLDASQWQVVRLEVVQLLNLLQLRIQTGSSHDRAPSNGACVKDTRCETRLHLLLPESPKLLSLLLLHL